MPAEATVEHPTTLDPEALRTRRRWTVDEYHSMAEAGILHEDDHLELIDGTIIEMSPIGNAHVRCVMRLNRVFNRLLLTQNDASLYVSVQNPVRLGPQQEPQPDVTIVRLPKDPETPISAEHVLLLVEVADTSLRYDREVKLPRYAAAGIPEVWIVDLAQQQVETYREPSATGYKHARFWSAGEALPVTLEQGEASVEVDALFE